MVWVTKSMFFLYLYPHFSKMDIFKMSFFENRVRDLKFLYIITSSASALPIFAGVPFTICLLFYFIIEWLHYAANSAERVFFAKDRANLGEPLFAKTGMADFRGCFEYAPRPIFNLCPKNGGLCFRLFRHFLAHFLGDLLYFIESGTADAFKYIRL